MTPTENLLFQAWEENQKADFQILQALSDLKDTGPEFDPTKSITNAIAHQTIASQKLDQAKTLINSK